MMTYLEKYFFFREILFSNQEVPALNQELFGLTKNSWSNPEQRPELPGLVLVSGFYNIDTFWFCFVPGFKDSWFWFVT